MGTNIQDIISSVENLVKDSKLIFHKNHSFPKCNEDGYCHEIFQLKHKFNDLYEKFHSSKEMSTFMMKIEAYDVSETVLNDIAHTKLNIDQVLNELNYIDDGFFDWEYAANLWKNLSDFYGYIINDENENNFDELIEKFNFELESFYKKPPPFNQSHCPKRGLLNLGLSTPEFKYGLFPECRETPNFWAAAWKQGLSFSECSNTALVKGARKYPGNNFFPGSSDWTVSNTIEDWNINWSIRKNSNFGSIMGFGEQIVKHCDSLPSIDEDCVYSKGTNRWLEYNKLQIIDWTQCANALWLNCIGQQKYDKHATKSVTLVSDFTARSPNYSRVTFMEGCSYYNVFDHCMDMFTHTGAGPTNPKLVCNLR